MLRVGIDCRMAFHSGIGTCIRNWLVRLPTIRPDWNFHIFGDPERLLPLLEPFGGRATLHSFTAPIYSPAEQIYWLRRDPGTLDVLWSPNFNAPLFWRGPLLVTIHDLLFFCHPEQFSQLKVHVARLMFRALRHRADCISFVSKFSSNEFIRLLGEPKGLSTVVHNGVDPVWSRLQRRPPADGRPFILFIGNIKEHKNLSRLLDAFEMLVDRIPHSLVLIGQFEDLASSDQLVMKRLRGFPSDRLHLAGKVGPAELLEAAATADLLVQPSLYEGFGLPPLEAMAAGCPVAVSRAASLPEICGEAAIYFDPLSVEDMAAALHFALTDREGRDRRIGIGRTRATGFSWETSTARHAELLEQVAGAAP